MSEARETVQRLADAFAVLTPDLSLEARNVSPTLYASLDRDFNGFRGHVLIAEHAFNANWTTWERHPAGDELVVLLSGYAELVLRTDAGDTSVKLQASGEYLIVPRNTWHTARVPEQARMLFVTPGEGTENDVLD